MLQERRKMTLLVLLMLYPFFAYGMIRVAPFIFYRSSGKGFTRTPGPDFFNKADTKSSCNWNVCVYPDRRCYLRFHEKQPAGRRTWICEMGERRRNQ